MLIGEKKIHPNMLDKSLDEFRRGMFQYPKALKTWLWAAFAPVSGLYGLYNSSGSIVEYRGSSG